MFFYLNFSTINLSLLTPQTYIPFEKRPQINLNFVIHIIYSVYFCNLINRFYRTTKTTFSNFRILLKTIPETSSMKYLIILVINL